MSDIKERRDAALSQAENSPSCSLPSIAQDYWPEMKGNGRMTICPFCHKKGDKFGIWPNKTGGWYWGCRVTSCPASIDTVMGDKKGNAIGLIRFNDGCDFNTAATKLCQRGGIEYPQWEERPPSSSKKSAKKAAKKAAKAAKKAATKAATASGKSPLIKIPEKFRNPWEEIYLRLSLTDADRDKLKRERGFTDETINLNGYRSSSKDNRNLLNELFDIFPEEQLLETGIAIRSTDTGTVKINAQLYGYGLEKRGSGKTKDKFGWVYPCLLYTSDAADEYQRV